ncbi:MAG: 30S ribosome-binding factor RbfA [Candidatus Omnitrophota bacterium]|nr:30S ribosome-binding factor RbfA [Candidatus Omnitrophota bacterium]
MSRQERVSEAIKKEVSLIVHDKLNDPRLGFVTIISVEITKDLRNAKVFFSVLGGPEDCKKTQAALDSAQGLIRSLVSQRLGLRFAPEIIFRQDRSSEYSVRIEEVINEIKALENAAPAEEATKKKTKKRKEKRDEPKKNSRRPKRKK